MRRLLVVAVAGLAGVVAGVVACGTLVPGTPGTLPALGVKVPAGAPLPLLQDIDPEDLDPARDVPGVPPIALAPPGGAVVQGNTIRIPRPTVPPGPRRIGIQVGHWKTGEVPAELGSRITYQTGTSWGGVNEVDVNLEIAQRIAAVMQARGYAVDIIPTTVPKGYLADVFVALHADGDGVGDKSGFKIAHGSRRGPYEDRLVAFLREAYANATDLPWDAEGISRQMSNYYSFNWGRYQHSAAAHTPAAILEMGFLSNDYDRDMLVNRTDVVVEGIVNGLQRFLDEVPRSKIFADDLIVPAQLRRSPSPSPSPGT